MKIAFTTKGTDLSAPMDERFGRASTFLVYDTDTKTCVAIDNRNQAAAQGAGIRSAETVANAGAKAVVTGICGPKAYDALKRAGIKIYTASGPTAQDALDLFLKGLLDEIRDA